MNSRIVVNTRALHGITTGVQRYTYEILQRLEGCIDVVSPPTPLHGFKGHMWEQLALPFQVRGKTLWSPANTGPLAVKNQVVSIMDMSTIEHPEWFSNNYSQWYQIIIPKLAKKVTKILTISEYSRNQIAKICQVDVNKVAVTPLAADPRFERKPAEEVSLVRKKLGIPKGRYILALSSLEPRKNLERLLVAWAGLLSRVPKDLWLVVAGAKGKALVFKGVSFEILPSRVYLTGYVPDEYLPALYSGADAFVYPSLYEGFGLPPLEAMACGIPVITSNTTSLPEVVGDAGLLVDPLSVDDIAFAIQRVIENDALHTKLRQKGLERSKLFSWDKTAALTWKVLQEAAEHIK
jgi:glycosyltransferase involved in cell wall biosynthesis